MIASNSLALMICILLKLASLPSATARALPFAFGNATNDIFLGPSDEGSTGFISLPRPLPYLGNNITSVIQYINGFIEFFVDGPSYRGLVNVYRTDIDTRNGGVNQNQVWLRVGNRTDDLIIARDIIAGNGTFFSPQTVIVGTWNKVEGFDRRAGPQNTFQSAIAYSGTGEAWFIFAFEQLQFFQAGVISGSFVEYRNRTNVVENFFSITSNAIMTSVLNGTNCNRTGVYAHRFNKGGPTKAPTKAPTKTPTKPPTKFPTKAPTKAPTKFPTMVPTPAPTPAKCGLFGLSILCPFTFCGVLGRWLGLCIS